MPRSLLEGGSATQQPIACVAVHTHRAPLRCRMSIRPRPTASCAFGNRSGTTRAASPGCCHDGMSYRSQSRLTSEGASISNGSRMRERLVAVRPDWKTGSEATQSGRGPGPFVNAHHRLPIETRRRIFAPHPIADALLEEDDVVRHTRHAHRDRDWNRRRSDRLRRRRAMRHSATRVRPAPAQSTAHRAATPPSEAGARWRGVSGFEPLRRGAADQRL
jgi:hypothetical protein